jgi:outer membrane protein assembly factor BamE (lipoprotein component of BamABCDE complex)
MAELQVGMSRADVLARLGEPERSEASDAQEKLYFWLSESRVNEAMFGGVMRGLNIGKGKYIVTLESGRVVSYRKTSRGE